MTRLLQLFAKLRSYGDSPCMETIRDQYTYAHLLREIEAWQMRLEEYELRPGDVVAVRAGHSFAATAALFAIVSRDAVAAMIPGDRDLQRYLADAHATALLELDPDGNHRLTALPAPPVHPLLERLRAEHEGGLVIFTSGSTGHPKAAVHSIERFLHKYDKQGRRLRTLAFLLLDHIAGLDTLFYTLANGGTVILTQRRDPQSIMQLISSHRIEVLPASPSFLRAVCALPPPIRAQLSSLRVVTYGSEPMDSGTLERLNGLLPNVQIIQKYGTTETGAPRCTSRSNDSLWLRIEGEGVRCRVIDDVLWLRSEGTILGYLNAPSPIDEGGWYCTGDLVDTDGEWIRFRGRLSDTINVGGEKVAPVQVEQVILELDFVQAAVVSGESHPLMGQVVAARVSLAANCLQGSEAVKRIRAHCMRRLPAHKVPLRILITTDLVSERHKTRRPAEGR